MHDIAISSLAIVIDLLSIAGGGGSSGGGGGGGGSSGGSFSGGSSGGSGISSPFDVIISVIIITSIVALAIYSSYISAKAVKERREKMRARLAIAGLSDPVWNYDTLATYAQAIFMQHQKDWSTFNMPSLQIYMTKQYAYHTQLMLAALQDAKRQNLVENIVVQSVEITGFNDDIDNTKDRFEAVIVAKVDDIINDTELGIQLHRQTIVATQTYKFIRSGKSWLFAGIDQSTASAATYNPAIQAFAGRQKFCYSIDWGWLLLPTKGQLFNSGKFGVADINNHVIGMYKQTLVQVYSYKPIPAMTKSYIIAQASLPKRYGNIVVRRKNSGLDGPTKGLNHLSTEWGDFNKKYDVYASDAEQATSFELLHPVFMEKLEALPFEVGIEVVDNIVYLYTNESATAGLTLTDDVKYNTMLELLKAAFKEMRM